MAQTNLINFKVDDKTLTLINDRAESLGKDRSTYLKELIRADLNEGKKSEQHSLEDVLELQLEIQRDGKRQYKKMRDAFIGWGHFDSRKAFIAHLKEIFGAEIEEETNKNKQNKY